MTSDPREPDRIAWSGVGLLLVIVAMASLAAAVLVHGSCTNPGPPVAVPEDGTPRAGWCHAVHGGSPWLVLVVPPVLACAVGCAAVGRRERWCYVVAALVCALVFGDVAYGDRLQFAYTT